MEANGKLVRYGYCWWFWKPSLRWNKGKFWRGQCTDLTFQWLRFSLNMTILRQMAESIMRHRPNVDVAWPVAVIDAETARHFDMQKLRDTVISVREKEGLHD
jgi:hypothetical protein